MPITYFGYSKKNCPNPNGGVRIRTDYLKTIQVRFLPFSKIYTESLACYDKITNVCWKFCQVLARNLKYLRKKSGKSQDELAAIFEINRTTWGCYENGKTDDNFRRFLFEKTYVEEVYNFAALRRWPKDEGGNFFASATSPVGVLFYSNIIPSSPSNRVLYCAPKSAVKNRLIDGVTIDPTDVQFLPRMECSKPHTIRTNKNQ